MALIGVRVDAGKCTGCGRCVARCGMDIRRVGDHECIHCGACAAECPTQAIRLKCGRITLPGAEAGKKKPARTLIAALLAAMLLVGVGYAVNRPAAQPIAEGAEAGMRCPDFTVPLYGAQGGSFALSAHHGQVTVINFWATWCAPCVAELPHFERLQREYGGRVSVVAIHSNLVTEDVQAFLDARGWQLPFAQDTDGGVIAALGGSTMLPMTVILDAQGVIVYNKVGSVTYEQLESLIAPLL